MRRPSRLVPSLVRLATYLAALAVLATARLPDAVPGDTASPSAALVAERPAPPAPHPAVRLLLAAILLGGAALELRGRRAAWR